MSLSCCRHVFLFFNANLFFSYAAPLFFLCNLCSMAQVGRGSPSIAMSPSCCRHVSFLCKSVLFLCCPPLFLMRLMLHGAGGTGGLPPSPCLPSCCRHVSFSMLICPFLMLPPPFSYAPWRRWDRGSTSIAMSPSCCRHVSFFMLVCPFLMLPPLFLMLHGAGGTGEGHPFTRPDLFWCYPLCGAGFFLCCVCPFLMLHGALSIHLHVSPSISMSPILLSTCLFSYAHGFFSYAYGFPFYAIGVFFYANLSFSYAAPSFSYAPRRRWHGGEGHPFTRPDLFWCYPLCEAGFFNAAFVLFLCFMGRFPSISMSLPPSPCLPCCCRHVCFLMPTGFSLVRAVSPLMPSVSFLLICPFLMLPPLLLMFHAAGGTGGGAPLYKTRPFLVLSFMRSCFFLCCVCPFLMLHGALSIHLQVSPSISMSPSCCRHVCFRTANLTFLCCSCPSCAPWAKGWGGGGHGAH